MQIFKGIDVFGGIGHEPNIYVIDGELVVDCGTSSFFSQIKDKIGEKYDHYKIKTVVNTHCHFDHMGATKKFRDWLKAEVCMHIDDKWSVESGENTLAEFFSESPKIVTVDRPLNDGNKIKTNNFTFTVLHTPGHTPGSICLYEKQKRILISGDTIFDETIGRTDLPGGNKNKMLMSLNKLAGLDVRYLFPGHGPMKMGGFSFHVKQMIAHFGDKRFINYDFY